MNKCEPPPQVATLPGVPFGIQTSSKFQHFRFLGPKTDFRDNLIENLKLNTNTIVIDRTWFS